MESKSPNYALAMFIFHFTIIPKNVKMYLHKKRGCFLKNKPGGIKMELFNELYYMNSFDFKFARIILEVLLVTSCISTIIFILTKNQYISYLSSAPLYYIFSWIGHGFTHLILLVLSMTIQAGIILLINRQSKKPLLLNEPKDNIQ